MTTGRIFTDRECQRKGAALAKEVMAGKFGSQDEARGVMAKLYYPPDAAIIIGVLVEMGALSAEGGD